MFTFKNIKSPPTSTETNQLTVSLVPKKRKQSIAVLRGPDVHLVAIQVCRAGLLGSVIISILACLSTTVEGTRRRLQCALSAAVCVISSVYYAQFYAIRKRPNLSGYSIAGNSAVDALRYASWSACIAMLAWNALIFRGPFLGDQDWLGMSYTDWVIVGPLFAAAGVLLGIPGWHSARSITKDASCSRGSWLVAAFILLLISVCLSMMLASTIQLAPFDYEQRTHEEVRLSRVMSAFWFVYPMVSFLRTLGMMVASSNLEIVSMLKQSYPKTAEYCCLGCTWCRVCVQRMFATVTMSPMDMGEFDRISEFLEGANVSFEHTHMVVSPVPIWITQISDFTIAIVDMITQVYSALACAMYAFPMEQ